MKKLTKGTRKKKTMSSYSEFYGGNLDEKYKYNNILKYKDFQNLNYAEFLISEIHPYVQAWISIEKTEQYKEYVLDFLRSFLSTIKSNRSFVTQKNEHYKNFKQTDKFTSHAPFVQARSTIKLSERVPTVEEMTARLNLAKAAFDANTGEVVYNDNIQNQDEMKKRKIELISGTKNLLKGIYNNTTSSNYQETFKGLPVKYPYAVKTDFATSGIKGIIPDPITLKRVKSNNEVGDGLKNTIKTMMFSDSYNSRMYR